MDQEKTFPRYNSYQDSGTDWLGEIPSDWSLETIRAVTQLKSEKNQPNMQVLSVYREYGVIPKDSRDDNHNATSLDTSGYKVVTEGDLVVNKMKAWQGSMGVSEHNGIVSPAYITCRVNAERVYPKFFHYLLRSQPYIGVYNALSYGVRVGQWDMHYEDFKHIPLPLPDRIQQECIANFLDQKTVEIDEAVAKKQRLIELLKEQKSILINHAVTKGLNPDTPMHDSGVEWIGEVPEHWAIKRIKHVTRKIVDGAHFTPTYVDEGVPFLRVTDISSREAVINLEEVRRIPVKEHIELSKRADAEKGDILLSKNGTIGITKVVDWDFEFSFFVSLCLIKPDKSLLAEYFCLFFDSPMVDEQLTFGSKRTSVTNLHLDKIKELLLALPPIEEQRDLVCKMSKLLEPFNTAIQKTNDEIELLNELKITIISNAVTGKIKL